MMITNFGFGSFKNPPVPPPSSGKYGSFYDTTPQTALANQPTKMKLNTTDLSNGVTVVNLTEITVAQTGVYNIQFSAQLYRTAGGTKEEVDIWFRKNGINIPQSDSKVTLANNGHYILPAWNFLIQLNAGENCEIMWATTSPQIILQAEPENLVVPHPAIPSVIVTCVQV